MLENILIVVFVIAFAGLYNDTQREIAQEQAERKRNGIVRLEVSILELVIPWAIAAYLIYLWAT